LISGAPTAVPVKGVTVKVGVSGSLEFIPKDELNGLPTVDVGVNLTIILQVEPGVRFCPVHPS
jgi:hypothetical protein